MKPVHRARSLSRLLLPFLFISAPAMADDFIWAGSGQSEDWGDSSHWLILSGNVASSTSSTPGSNDNFEAEVLLNDSFHLDLDGNRSIRDIDVEMFGGTVAQIGQSVGDYTLTLERKLEVDRLTFSGASNSDRTTLTIYSDLRPTWNTNATTFLGNIGLGEKQTAIIEGAIITDPPTVAGVFDQAADFITLRGTSSSDSNASIYKIPGDKAQMQRCISLFAAQLIAETGDDYASTNLRVSNLGTFTVNAPTSLGYLASATADFPKLTLNADLSFGGNGYDALSDLKVSGTGNLTKSGNGKHSFQGEFDGWSGNFTASEGTLELSTGGTFPSTSELKIEGNGSLALKEAESIGGLCGSGSLTLEAALSLGGGNVSETFSGTVSGASNVTKVGTGSQLFSGDHSSFTGTYQVDAGTLEMSGSADLGSSSSVSIASGATFIGRSADSVAGVSGAGTLDLQNHLSIGTGNNTSTFSGSMTGNGDFTMNDNGGTFTFSGDRSTHTGNLTVSAGELILEVDSALSSTHNFSLPANAKMTFATGVYQRMAALSGAGTLEVNGHLEFGSDSTVSALDGALMGAGQFTKVGNLNLNLNANNSFNGVATILDGTVTVGSSGNGFQNTGSVYIDDGATYNINSLMGNYEVKNGTTIGGDGRVAGDMSLKFDAMIAPGMQNAIGALTTDNITMQDDAVLEWEISDWTGSATEGWDQLICDDLTIDSSGANWIVRIIPNSLVNATEEDRTFEIVRADNLINFSPSTVTIDDNRWSGSGTWSVVEGPGSNLLLIYDVPDTTAPVITLNGSTPVTVECGSTYTDAGATAFDVSDNTATAVTVVITDSSQTTVASVDTSSVGSYIITYSSTDSENNTGMISRIVNVVDTTAPVVTITGGNSMTHEWGQTFIVPGSSVSDNCDSSLTAVVSGSASVNDSTGTYAVTYTATDSAGNVGTATLTVTTVDTTNPVLSLNGNATVYVELGVETYTESGATVTDVETGLVVDIDDDDVNNTEAGTYTVTYDVTDSSGNQATQITRTVVVRDTINPVIALVGDNPAYIECGVETYRDPGTTITDAGTPSLVAAVGGDTVDSSTLGTYTVTYNATDLAGNVATQIMRTVIVRDTTAPAILITGGITTSLALNDTYVEQGATAIDACDGTIPYANFTSTVSNVNTAAYGTYTVTYTVQDSSGNESSSSRTVLVTHSTLDWTGAADTQWRTLGNWGSASQYPGSVTDVNFYGTATSFTVDLNSTIETCKNLLFDSATSYTIQNGILSVTGGSVEVDQGTHTINALLDLSANTTVDVASGTTLTNSLGALAMDSIEKVGAGTWSISGNLAWMNDFDVSAGEIEFGSSFTIAPGMNLTVDSGATLDFSNVPGTTELIAVTLSGAGTLQGDVSLGADATVKPGDSGVGKLAVGDLALGNNVTYDWELANWAGSAGTGWDTVEATGTVLFTSSAAMPVTIKITESSLQNFIEQDASFAVISATAVNGFDAGLISIDGSGFTSGNGTWSVSLENNTIYLNYNSPVVAGDPVTVQGVTVAGVASLTEGDLTGGTVTVSVNSLPTMEPLMMTLSFDDEQLQVSINASHVGDNFISVEPGTGNITFMFFNDVFLGESSQLSYTLDVVAVDDPEIEGNQTVTLSASVTALVEDPPNPPMPTMITDFYGIEIIDDDSYYKIWALMNGLSESVNDGLTQDPNGDGKTNLEHFAVGTSPIGDSGASGLQKQAMVDVEGIDYYTITLPVRAGASFSGTPLSTGNIDGITYAFRANSDLSSNHTINVTELTPVDVVGLDSVPTGYEYKTFGIPVSANDEGFMRIKITSSP